MRTIERCYLRTFTRRMGRALADVLCPASCDYCGDRIDESAHFLCQTCWEALAVCTTGDYCPRCGLDVSPHALLEGSCPQCLGVAMGLDGIARCGIYADILQGMIPAFKNGKTELDRLLAFLTNNTLMSSGFRGSIQMFVPVPLHWSRRLARGYNQAHLLARGLQHPQVRVQRVLKRIRRTRPQPAVVTPAARARNVAGAFALRQPSLVKDIVVCLVDDVKTTGATLNECARVLKMAGAARVYALVLAVAGQRS
ncbi:ComF family protein [Planctomycetota bacterium]